MNKAKYVYVLRFYHSSGCLLLEGVFTTLHRAKRERPGFWVKHERAQRWSHDQSTIDRVDLNVHYS